MSETRVEESANNEEERTGREKKMEVKNKKGRKVAKGRNTELGWSCDPIERGAAIFGKCHLQPHRLVAESQEVEFLDSCPTGSSHRKTAEHARQ
jgi:hypothetical protein